MRVVVRGVVAALLVVTTACTSTPDARDAEPTGVVATPPEASATPRPSTRTTVTATTVDGTPPGGDPRPVDLAAAVDLRVADGSFTEVEAVRAALAGFLGLDPAPAGLTVDDVLTPGLTALLSRAESLTGEDDVPARDRDELDALLRHVVPTQEVMDAISRPADQTLGLAVAARSSVASVQLVAAATGDGCAPVRDMGFSQATDTGTACYRFEEEGTGDERLGLYYPADWVGDPGREAQVRDAGTAMRDSRDTYAGLGLPIGRVNLVFSLRDAPDGKDGVVAAFPPVDDATCPVTIFPAAQGRGTDAVYRQVIAHEMFHCVQARHFDHAAVTAENKWWVEGTAEFFSNLVEPAANAERKWAESFDSNSRSDDLTTMSYENFVFFQWYANVLGIDGVTAFMDTMSTSGGGSATEVLGRISQMPGLFQDFAVAYMARAVLDSDGTTRWGGRLVSDQVPISDVGKTPLGVDEYVLARWRLDYTQQRRFVQQSPGAVPRHAVAPFAQVTDTDAWTTMATEIRSGCDDDEVLLLVATNPEYVTFDLDVVEVETAECDPCLLGPWEMQLATFETYMGNVFASLGDVPAGMRMAITGHYYVEFDDEGGLRALRRPLSIAVEAAGVALPPTVIEGDDTGRYTTDGRTLGVSGLQGTAEASMGGVSVGPFASGGPDGAQAMYTCDGDLLTITDPSYGAITFDRLEEIPEPEAVEVETGNVSSADD